MPKSVRSLAFFIFITLGIGLTAQRVVAAQCYFHSANLGYICETRPVPPQFVSPIPEPDGLLDHRSYAYLDDYVNVYPEPTTAVAPLRNVGRGYFYVSVNYPLKNDQGELWYMINPGEYVPESAIRPVEISQFSGVVLTSPPERPFGWILARVRPSSTPGGEPNPDYSMLERYTFFEVMDAQVVPTDDDWIWYNIGGDRWIRQTYVGLVDPSPRPAEVGENEFWSEVDLYEQTFAAYEGDRMVFASLISSGLNRWPTREGLYQVWDRWDETLMDGAEGKVDYYVVEDVPYTMYFDKVMEIALHGAYWHDRFGYKHSHGCVNMPPLAAQWVYNWSATGPDALWVYVHTSDPTHYFTRFGQRDG
ncbi:MAG: L,D-transpeptidase [Anaerolineales bacterium]|nr:L,D-transpeptidase [Anaerolineales bacterium]MCB8952232.1 L,D-transpeptidase [Ardenticatenales bacterium]